MRLVNYMILFMKLICSLATILFFFHIFLSQSYKINLVFFLCKSCAKFFTIFFRSRNHRSRFCRHSPHGQRWKNLPAWNLATRICCDLTYRTSLKCLEDGRVGRGGRLQGGRGRNRRATEHLQVPISSTFLDTSISKSCIILCKSFTSVFDDIK